MAHSYRSVLFVGCLAGMTMALRGPAACADDVAASPFQQSITAWMGAVSFLADDGDAGGERADEKKCECDSEGECGCKEKGEHREHRHRGEQWQRGERGERGRSPGDRQAKAPREGTPAGGPRPDAIRKLDEILARLSRIEAGMGMGGRPGVAGGPMGQGMVLRMGPADGPAAAERTRPAMPAEAQAMMEQRMEEGRRRMEESREKMQQARRRFAEMEERIKKLEAEIERMKGAK